MKPLVRLLLAIAALVAITLTPGDRAQAAEETCVGCFESALRVYANCMAQGGGDWGCSGAMCTYIETRCNFRGCGYNCP